MSAVGTVAAHADAHGTAPAPTDYRTVDMYGATPARETAAEWLAYRAALAAGTAKPRKPGAYTARFDGYDDQPFEEQRNGDHAGYPVNERTQYDHDQDEYTARGRDAFGDYRGVRA